MVQEEDPNGEEERDFDLSDHDEPEQRYTCHGVEIIDLENQDEETIKDIIIQEREAQVQALENNLGRAKYVITYLEQENKQLSAKQVLMELEILKLKRHSGKETQVTLTPIIRRLKMIGILGLRESICTSRSCYGRPTELIRCSDTWPIIIGLETRFAI